MANVDYGVELEKHNERIGQIEQERIINPYGTVAVPSLQGVVEQHNAGLAERIAALSPELRAAREAAIARSI